jgi:hypothetical protein
LGPNKPLEENMDPSLTAGLAAVFGSVVGAFASIGSTWLTQQIQKERERAHEAVQRREAIYSEFISETARLTADAFRNTLEHPENLSNIYAMLSRINLLASDPVCKEAEKCCNYVVALYLQPNLTVEQICDRLQVSEHPIRKFSAACRAELQQVMK